MEKLKSQKIKDIMVKVKTYTIYFTFALAIVLFIYALGFSTNLDPLTAADDLSVHQNLQKFNKQLFYYSVYAIILIAITFFLRTSKRKILYFTNMIAIFLVIAMLLINSFYLLGNLNSLKESYLTMDLEEVIFLYKTYKINTFAFHFGNYLAIFILINVIALLIVFIYNFIINFEGYKNFFKGKKA